MRASSSQWLKTRHYPDFINPSAHFTEVKYSLRQDKPPATLPLLYFTPDTEGRLQFPRSSPSGQPGVAGHGEPHAALGQSRPCPTQLLFSPWHCSPPVPGPPFTPSSTPWLSLHEGLLWGPISKALVSVAATL